MHRRPLSTGSGLFFALLIFVAATTPKASQAQSLQSPAEFLGYELGSRFTPHHRVMDYVRHVGAASPLVTVKKYGESVEHRELTLAFVASEANHARLEDIRTNNLSLTGLADGPGSTDDAAAGTPAIVWLSYNVHGNESVSTEAAMQTLFDLADPSNARTKSWLENTVVVIDPAINPDGRDRYVNWYNRMVGAFPDVDPDAVEHDEPWPGGRTNHYYFDLNRDWVWLSQKESRLRVAEYNRWMPHVHVDFHEQGINSPYYFAPAARPYHPVITDWQQEFQETIGRNHATYFDREGWLFFTKQVFDLFYPGYGDTFPTYNGAIGMTYEQAGSGRAGLGVLTATGDTLTLADRIAHHHTTGLSTVEAASMNRDRVVQEFSDYFSRHLTTPPDETQAWVVRVHDGERRRVEDFARHIEALGIRTATLSEDARVDGFSYRTGDTGRRDVRAGDLVVPAAQPKAILAKVLLEPDGQIPDSLTYDITAWSLPYAYDLDAVASRTAVDADPGWAVPASHAAGDGIEPGNGDAVAWLVPWGSEGSVRTLSALLRKGMKVRFSERKITLDGHSFEPGVLVVTRADNRALGETLGETIRAVAASEGIGAFPASTGYVDDGPDLGSGDIPYLERPRIGVPFGSPVSSSGAGEVWHYFDERIEYPVTRFPADELGRGDLDEYDVIVLPGGFWGSVLNEAGLDHLRSWIRSGGRLVALGSGADFLAGKDGFALKEADEDKDEDSAGADSVDAEPSDYAQRDRDRLSEDNPGAIFKVHTDPSHPLGFGFRDELFVLRRSESAPPLMDEDDGWNVGVVSGDGLVSGHVGHEARADLENTLSFGHQRMGSGSVAYLPDDPLYRGFWYSGRQLFANAVFLSGQ